MTNARLQQLISQTHRHGVALAKQIAQLTHTENALKRLNVARRRQLAIAHEAISEPFTMYDSTEVGQIPPAAVAVAGYVGGRWATFPALTQRFPRAKRLSIAVNASEDADCLDVENGDATPAQAPSWVRRQHARGLKRPVLYADRSTMPAVTAALENNGIPRSQYRLWVADYTNEPHIPSGCDACQWTDKALGRNLDASYCTADFLD